jgi:hypothetical protein
MKKLTQRLATTGVFAALVAGTLLTTGGVAAAATPQTAGHTPASATRLDTGDHQNRDRDHDWGQNRNRDWGQNRDGDWNWGQNRDWGRGWDRNGDCDHQWRTNHRNWDQLTTFDPWVRDQVIVFAPDLW